MSFQIKRSARAFGAVVNSLESTTSTQETSVSTLETSVSNLIADAVVSDQINEIVKLTQAAYDALTPDANTLYVIVG